MSAGNLDQTSLCLPLRMKTLALGMLTIGSFLLTIEFLCKKLCLGVFLPTAVGGPYPRAAKSSPCGSEKEACEQWRS